jgi:hypothetical protein
VSPRCNATSVFPFHGPARAAWSSQCSVSLCVSVHATLGQCTACTPSTPPHTQCRIRPQMINVSAHLIQRNDRCAHFVKNSLGRLSAWRRHCEGAHAKAGGRDRPRPSPKVCMFIFNFNFRVRKNEISRSSQMSTREGIEEGNRVSSRRAAAFRGRRRV